MTRAVTGDRVPRLVVTDMDGTFLSPDGTVSEQNRTAVLAAQQAGIMVLFATGRPIRWLDVIRDLPGAHPTVIASNGAVLYDLGTGELLDRICIDPAVALRAVLELRSTVPGTVFAFESGTRFGAPGSGFVRLNVGTSTELLTEGVARMAAALR